MDKISKALNKLTEKERKRVKTLLLKLKVGKTEGLDIKKLKDRSDIFRARTGDLRIIYRTDIKENISVLEISRRNEKTYKF
jgi:mRNA-degrading endonuclease RelE of RelBE toxin-antitoxin system